MVLVFLRNFFSSNIISGKRIRCGGMLLFSLITPADAASQPACLPITSKINTFVDEFAIDATSRDASNVEVAIYLATDPNPGQLSVTGRSLSIVLGKPIHVTS